jgi:hypothetical protein
VIRITFDNSKGSRLVVEGHLSGSAVDELRKSCATCGARTVLDFVIEGCSSFITELLLSNAGAKVT